MTGFFKRCCPIAEKEVSALRLLIGLQERANVQNQSCALVYNGGKFSILGLDRTAFHLSTLEANYIKTSKPINVNKKNSCMA